MGGYFRYWLKNMNHNDFKNKWLGQWYMENSTLGFQCVAWVKIYCEEVYWITLWSFWWTAYNWFTTWSPFNKTKWEKILNTPEFVPEQWDIIFFDKDKQNWMCWHVWIVDSADLNSINILNQNMWTWTWKADSDKFKLSKFDYLKPKCLWVYRLKKQKEDYEEFFKRWYMQEENLDNPITRKDLARILERILTKNNLK